MLRMRLYFHQDEIFRVRQYIKVTYDGHQNSGLTLHLLKLIYATLNCYNLRQIFQKILLNFKVEIQGCNFDISYNISTLNFMKIYVRVLENYGHLNYYDQTLKLYLRTINDSFVSVFDLNILAETNRSLYKQHAFDIKYYNPY